MYTNQTKPKTDELWSDFLGLAIGKQLSILYQLDRKTAISFLQKLKSANLKVFKNLFKKLDYHAQQDFIEKVSNEEQSEVFELLSQQKQFRLLSEGSYPSLHLPRRILISYVKWCLEKIPVRNFTEIKSIDRRCRSNPADMYKILGEYQQGFENNFIHFYSSLSAFQKFLLFRNLSLEEYMKVRLSFHLYLVGVICSAASTINYSNVEEALYGNGIDGSDYEQKDIDRCARWYIDECVRRKGTSLIQKLIKSDRMFTAGEDYANDSSFFGTKVLTNVLEKLSNAEVRRLIVVLPETKLFVPEDRLFYIREKDMNTNFDLLIKEFQTGILDLGSVTPVNKVRLLATV